MEHFVKSSRSESTGRWQAASVRERFVFVRQYIFWLSLSKQMNNRSPESLSYITLCTHVCQYIYLLEFLMNNLFFMLFWNNDYSWGLAGHTWPVTSVVRQASAQCCWLCYLSSNGLEESERHRSQKIYRSSEENRSKWVVFRIAIYRSSGYNLIFCPAVSAELPGVLMFWNPTDAGHKVACRACVRIPMYSGCKHRAPLWFTENSISVFRCEYYRSQYRLSI